MIKYSRNILLPFLIAIAPISAFAQHDEIDLSVGTLNATEVLSISDLIYGYNFNPSHPVPDYFASYKHYFHNHIGFGCSIGCFFDEGTTDRATGTYKRSSIVVASEVSFPYVIRHGFKFYALVGAGLRFSSEKYTYDGTQSNWENTQQSFVPSEQLTPLAFRFGTKVGGFLELGWGYKGMVNLGLFCKI